MKDTRNFVLNSAHLPPELLHRIICQLVAEHIDHIVAGAVDVPYSLDTFSAILTPEEESRNPIVPLFRISYQVRDIVRKVLSDALGIDRREDGSLELAPWKLIGTLRQLYGAIWSLNGDLLADTRRRMEELSIPKRGRLTRGYSTLAYHLRRLFPNSIETATLPEMNFMVSLTSIMSSASVQGMMNGLRGPVELTAPLRRRFGSFLWSCHVCNTISVNLEQLKFVIQGEVVQLSRSSGASPSENGEQLLLLNLKTLLNVFQPSVKYDALQKEWGQFPADSISPVMLEAAFQTNNVLYDLAVFDLRFPMSDQVPAHVREVLVCWQPHIMRAAEWAARRQILRTIHATRRAPV